MNIGGIRNVTRNYYCFIDHGDLASNDYYQRNHGDLASNDYYQRNPRPMQRVKTRTQENDSRTATHPRSTGSNALRLS
jgi:hypothetical protein